VTISAGGKGLARNSGRISGLHAMEEILDESGAAIRHLRCGLFMENFLSQARSIHGQGLIFYPMPAHVPISMMAVADVADVALRWLVRQDWKGIEDIAVHVPEDVSFGEAAAIMARVLERPVRYEQTSVQDFVQTLVSMGASAQYARSQVEMFTQLAHGMTRAEPRSAESTTPTLWLLGQRPNCSPPSGCFVRHWKPQRLRRTASTRAVRSKSAKSSRPRILARI
jgi:uncharacterized protein YbjT (DUF2867 family)